MGRGELNRLLGELEAELGNIPDLDESEREALADLRRQIGQVLDTDGRQAPEADAPVEPLMAYVDRFETSHPTLTMILGRIADALNKMGI
jgi:hypothetical protein